MHGRLALDLIGRTAGETANSMSRIERLQQTGILRRGKKRFRYVSANGGRLNRADIARIEALRIPPAWTGVAINRSAGGMLQAVGKDDAGRWQYLYHPKHVAERERKKFERLLKFAQAIPTMRRVVNRNLRKRGLDRDRVMSSVLRILSTCMLRAGSQVYADENGSYGLATLKPKHVSVKGDVVEFNFPGKRQIVQHRELRDRPVARIVRQLLKVKAKEVFKYQNGNGEFVDVKRRDINQYIKEVMGDRFTSKDFRTWAGTLICACALARAGAEQKETAASRKKKIVQAVKETASILGNTPAVCRSAYICPDVLKSFERGRVVEEYYETTEDLLNHRGTRIHRAERALLRLLKQKS